jgi:hypothetical protein
LNLRATLLLYRNNDLFFIKKLYKPIFLLKMSQRHKKWKVNGFCRWNVFRKGLWVTLVKMKRKENELWHETNLNVALDSMLLWKFRYFLFLKKQFISSPNVSSIQKQKSFLHSKLSEMHCIKSLYNLQSQRK